MLPMCRAVCSREFQPKVTVIPPSSTGCLLWVLYPDQLSVAIFTFDLLTTFWVSPTSVLQIILLVSRHEKGSIISFPWQIYSRRHQHIIRELDREALSNTLDLHALMAGILVIDSRFTSLTYDQWMSSSVRLQSNLFTFDEMCWDILEIIVINGDSPHNC